MKKALLTQFVLGMLVVSGSAFAGTTNYTCGSLKGNGPAQYQGAPAYDVAVATSPNGAKKVTLIEKSAPMAHPKAPVSYPMRKAASLITDSTQYVNAKTSVIVIVNANAVSLKSGTDQSATCSRI